MLKSGSHRGGDTSKVHPESVGKIHARFKPRVRSNYTIEEAVNIVVASIQADC